MSKSVLLLCAAVLLPSLTALARAENKCGDNTPSTYAPAAGDSANSTQLKAARKLASTVTALEVNVCAGELVVQRSPTGDRLEVRVSSPGADRSLQEYLHDFSANGSKARLDLRVPSNYHASVTLIVPAAALVSSQVNLGAGSLTLDASALGGGDRQVNVGAGNATVALHGDRNYAQLKVNIGMGHFEDERKGGSSASLVIAREMDGTGKGEMEINVGAGRVLLKPASE